MWLRTFAGTYLFRPQVEAWIYRPYDHLEITGHPVNAAAQIKAARLALGLGVLIVMFGIYLPLFSASLLAVKLIEKCILSRIPTVRDWLGLHVPLQQPRHDIL